MNKERFKTLQTAEQSVTYQFQEFLIFVDVSDFFGTVTLSCRVDLCPQDTFLIKEESFSTFSGKQVAIP